MIKHNICKRTLALALAAVMLASFASCARGKNGAAVSESDTAPHSQKADDGLYYPVTKESFYDEFGALLRCYEYAYSPEGYLLKEWQSKSATIRGGTMKLTNGTMTDGPRPMNMTTWDV